MYLLSWRNTNNVKKIPKQLYIKGMETFIPPIMKNIGVIIANATVLNLALTSPFCVFLKWSESITPSINAGNMACPPPRLPKNINPKSKTKTYFISSSPILFLNNKIFKIITWWWGSPETYFQTAIADNSYVI